MMLLCYHWLLCLLPFVIFFMISRHEYQLVGSGDITASLGKTLLYICICMIFKHITSSGGLVIKYTGSHIATRGIYVVLKRL